MLAIMVVKKNKTVEETGWGGWGGTVVFAVLEECQSTQEYTAGDNQCLVG